MPRGRAQAIERLTAALLRHEGAPDNEKARTIAWPFVHELPGRSTSAVVRRKSPCTG
jgi:hypothetical protein